MEVRILDVGTTPAGPPAHPAGAHAVEGRAGEGRPAPRPARVLFVIGSLNVGGSERHLLHLAGRLDRARFAPMICCLFNEGPLFGAALRRGIPCICLNIRGGRNRLVTGVNLLRTAVRLIRAMRRERVVILDAYLFVAYALAIPCGWLAGVPVRIAQRRGLSTSKPRLPGRRLLERVVNRLTTQVVANSRATAQDTAVDECLPPERIRVIHNGVEVPAGPPARGARPPGLPAAGRIVLCVANLIHYKGHLTLLEAAAEVLPAFREAALVLVGEGGMRDTIREAVTRSGLQERILLLGQREDVPALLAAADLFVLPSHEESFSNALLEAMAHGLPVIATAVGGNAEIVEDGVSGVLVPPRDPAALAGALAALLADPAAARRLGEQGRARAGRLFHLNRMVRETEALYATLLARHVPAHGAGPPS